TEGGLRRVAGNAALYRRLLLRFCTQQATAPSQIRQAWAAGDHETAYRLSHTLKGVAANLGMHQVQSRAATVELALRDPAHGSREAALQQLESALAEAIQAVERLGAEVAQAEDAASPEAGEI